MDLATALGLESGELVALIGAGGKTTAAWQLLRSLVASGERVVFTTTTYIFEPQKAPLLLNPWPEPANIVQSLLIESPALFLAATRAEKGNPQQAARSPYPALPARLKGLDPHILTELARRVPGATWLVEADNAQGRPLKAPAEDEPAMPPGADRIIVVASLEALGRRIEEQAVQHPDIAAAILGTPLGTPITPELMITLLSHPAGGLKRVPKQAAVIALLTQQGKSLHPSAHAIGQKLAAGTRIQRVVLTSLHDAAPVVGVWP
ncbi:MAG: putative selenium-dependent hydroxylase accessory protein YqeC [Anaerolineae bacterium]|nr:putative selenium-dependent hydroxylase accessory protein YqeC [Anaerolineae bacterium]